MMEALLRLGLNNTQFQACISLAGLLCVFHFHHVNLLLLTSSLCIPFRRNSLSLFTHELGTLQLCTRFCKKVFQLWHRSPRREQAVQVCLSVLIWGDEVQVHLGRGSCGDLIRWRSLPCSVRISVRKQLCCAEQNVDVLQQTLPVFASKRERGMVTLLPVSLSTIVSPVIAPSSGTSHGESDWATSPPLHLITLIVLDLYRLKHQH